jgi:hypothetical protein
MRHHSVMSRVPSTRALVPFLLGPALVGAAVGGMCAAWVAMPFAAGAAYLALAVSELGAAVWSERLG